MATISDIAKKCHCSTTTVSKVLNGSGNISDVKKKEILEAARELKYVRNNSARTLASSSKSSSLIGIILHINEDKSITHELFSNILNYFRIEMEKNGFDICFIRHLEEDSPYEYEDYIASKGVDGVFILSASIDLKKIQNLINSHIPFVGFDLPSAKYNISSDNKEAVAHMVDYLVSLGHRRICYISPKDVGVASIRTEGFIEGLKRNNIAFDERMIVRAPFYSNGSAKSATDKSFASGINPTAIMYPDDYTAISAIPYLRSLGKKVPRDISITGFDGVEVASVMRPEITTSKQDVKNIGIEAAKLLLKQIKKETIDNPCIVVKTSLQKGESAIKI